MWQPAAIWRPGSLCRRGSCGAPASLGQPPRRPWPPHSSPGSTLCRCAETYSTHQLFALPASVHETYAEQIACDTIRSCAAAGPGRTPPGAGAGGGIAQQPHDESVAAGLERRGGAAPHPSRHLAAHGRAPAPCCPAPRLCQVCLNLLAVLCALLNTKLITAH